MKRQRDAGREICTIATSPSPQPTPTGSTPAPCTAVALPEVRVVTVSGLEGERIPRLSPAHQIAGLEIPRGFCEGAAMKSAYRKGFLEHR